MTSDVETELSTQVVFPNGEFEALALANLNIFGDQISKKSEIPQQRRLLQADNETPLPGGGGGASK